MTHAPLADDPARDDEDPLAILREAHDGLAEPGQPEPGDPTSKLASVQATPPNDCVGAILAPVEGQVVVELDVVPRVQFSMHANDVPVLRSIRVENRSAEALREVTVVLRAEPAFSDALVLRLGDLRSGAAQRLSPAWELDAGLLDRLTERVSGRVLAEVAVGEQVVARTAVPTTVFTRAEWPGNRVYPELLAAFVMPNDGVVGDLLRSAGEFLAQWTGSPSLDGYQRDDPEVVLRQVAAIYGALSREQIQYVSPPASFESEGQRVRLPRQIAATKQAACLDLSLFAAAAMEAAGLHPFVVMVEGHAFCGAHLEQRTWPDAVTDDGARLRNELELARLVVFDPTCAVAGQAADFETARHVAKRHLADDEKFRVAVDVRRARLGGVRPMASVEHRTAAERPAEVPTARSVSVATPDASAALAARARRAPAAREASEGPARIEAWKRKLLDLSLRNRLLNLPARGRIVRFMVPDVARLEDALADGARFTIQARPGETAEEDAVEVGTARPKRSEEELRELLAAGQAGRTLYADLDAETLDKRLTALRRESQTAEEEGGSSNLYLAVGLLKFFETEKSQKLRLAPIVLVPVKLVQRTARAGVELEARPEDARINVTLLRFLECVHNTPVAGVDPPPDDGSGLDVPLIFQRFREEISGKRGWEVLEEARIGMFSFSKILIWRDLDECAERLLESPVVHHLVETPGESFSDGIEFRAPGELDRVTRSGDIYVPMSADSSQLAAILAAAEGKSFVLIGPPGTGKSQTITNMITHCLAKGKTVLFVSEKMAALEVVHRRLEQVGLQEKCLELHSGKANKKEVLTQLERSLNAVKPPADVVRDGIARDLDQVRDRLNGYVEALHRERPSGESVFGVLSRLIGLRKGPTVDLGWTRIGDTRAEALERARRVAAETQASAQAAVVGPTHPLNGIAHREYSILWEEQAEEALRSALDRLRAIQATEKRVRSGLSGDCPLPLGGDLTALLDLIELLRGAPRWVTGEALVDDDWASRQNVARTALRAVEQLRVERAHFSKRYARAAGDIEPRGLLEELQAAESRWFLPRFFALRAWTRRFTAIADPKRPVDPTMARADLERLMTLQERERDLGRHEGELQALFAEGWRGERSELDTLEACLKWVDAVRSAAVAVAALCGSTPDALLADWSRYLPSGGGLPDDLERAMAAFDEQRQVAARAATAAVALLAPDDPTPWRTLDVERCLALGRRWLDAWDRNRLRSWCRWQAARTAALDADLGALVEAVESGTIQADTALDTLERSYGKAWYKHTVSADPVLRDFQSESHERAIQRFRDLDAQLLTATHRAVRSRIAAHRRATKQLLGGPQAAFLRREIQKQRRHRPIRTLFKEGGNLIRELRPCVLMSPHSVAQFLDPSLPRFDVVVFDEASQMPVWDAIGAIARGNQLIVVGDPKQLPPTNFFGRSHDGADGEERDDGDDTEIEDLESVLDECMASNLATHALSWHYRSRHESLIAFSNRHYYEGKLITFPAAENEGVGLTWRPVADGIYDFGKSRTNRREAEEVVSEIVRRLRDPEMSKRSIGVVALSQAQQSLVEDLLDKARREHPELEPFFDSGGREPVFVKNLENVQGDERDVILFTVCYGPDLSGRVRMNFGPLNREGGWRRLNVAISRARCEMVVFSTLRADQIDLNRTRSSAVRDLRRFLEFAERGEAAFAAELETDRGAEHDSPFEAEVCIELERRGWAVHRQVGCSGYRIDLAVVDPGRPGRFLLGIECDGASYHSAPSARDRDKLRQELLEGLGWTLHRIWSTDWWEDRERQVEELLAALEVAKSRPVGGAPEGVADEQRGAHELEAAEPALDPGITNSGAQEVRLPGATSGAASPWSSILDAAPDPVAERVARVLQRLVADPNAYEGRLEWYNPTPIQTLGDQQAFYKPEHGKALASALHTVVRSEGPIVAELAACRVAQMWDYSHLKDSGVEHVLGHVHEARVRMTWNVGERILWLHGDAPAGRVPARVSRDGCSLRPINQIPVLELASLLRFWSEEAGPMSVRDLYDHALRTIGLQKLDRSIRARFEAALAEAVRQQWVSSSGDFVRLVA